MQGVEEKYVLLGVPQGTYPRLTSIRMVEKMVVAFETGETVVGAMKRSDVAVEIANMYRKGAD